MENVPQVLTSPLWGELVGRLEAMGYRNRWAKLDSSRFGSAQKRVRAFMVSRLGAEPPELPTEDAGAPALCLRDVMEPTREERYVKRIPLDRVRWREIAPKSGESTPSASIEGETFYSKAMLYSSSSSSPTVRTEHGKNSQIKVIADWQREGRLDLANRIYSDDGISPALVCHGGGNHEIKVFACSDDEGGLDQNIIPSKTFRNRRYFEADGASPCVTASSQGLIKVVDPKIQPGGCYTKDGGLDMNMRHRTVSARKRRLYMGGGAAPTVLQSDGKIEVFEEETTDGYLAISVLTPRECWRLMGFPEWAYFRASKVSSETQLYNQAGNSIVVEVLEAIFRTMFSDRRVRRQTCLKEFSEAEA